MYNLYSSLVEWVPTEPRDRIHAFSFTQLIQAGRRLYKTPGQHLTLGQVVELNKRLLEGYQHFQNEPRIQKLKEDVLRYNRSIRDLGLKDHQVGSA